MSGFDPSAIQDIGTQPDYGGAMAKGFQLKDLVDQNQMNQLKLNSMKSEQADNIKAKSILSTSDLQTEKGLAEASEKLTKAGMPEKAMDLRKYGQSVTSGELDLQRQKVDLHVQAQSLITDKVDGVWAAATQMKEAKTPDGRPKYTDASINAFISGQIPAMLNDIQTSDLPDPVKQTALSGIAPVLQKSGSQITYDQLTQFEQQSKKGLDQIKQHQQQLLGERKEQVAEGTLAEKTRHDEATERHMLANEDKAAAGRKTPAGFEWDPEKPDELRPIKGGPKDPNSKPWTGREKVYAERIMGSAREASADLQNIVELPIGASTGMLGIGGHQGTGAIATSFGALKNKVSDQEVQDYNVMISGIQRNLSAIESMGLAPSGSLTSQMESVVIKPGDSQLTKLRRLAQTKQIIEKGLDTPLSDPAIPDVMKDAMRETVATVTKAVPFTQHDITELQRRSQKDPKITLQDVMKKDNLGGGGPGPQVGTVQQGYKFKGGDPADQKNWEKVGG